MPVSWLSHDRLKSGRANRFAAGTALLIGQQHKAGPLARGVRIDLVIEGEKEEFVLILSDEDPTFAFAVLDASELSHVPVFGIDAPISVEIDIGADVSEAGFTAERVGSLIIDQDQGCLLVAKRNLRHRGSSPVLVRMVDWLGGGRSLGPDTTTTFRSWRIVLELDQEHAETFFAAPGA